MDCNIKLFLKIFSVLAISLDGEMIEARLQRQNYIELRGEFRGNCQNGGKLEFDVKFTVLGISV